MAYRDPTSAHVIFPLVGGKTIRLSEQSLVGSDLTSSMTTVKAPTPVLRLGDPVRVEMPEGPTEGRVAAFPTIDGRQLVQVQFLRRYGPVRRPFSEVERI